MTKRAGALAAMGLFLASVTGAEAQSTYTALNNPNKDAKLLQMFKLPSGNLLARMASDNNLEKQSAQNYFLCDSKLSACDGVLVETESLQEMKGNKVAHVVFSDGALIESGPHGLSITCPNKKPEAISALSAGDEAKALARIFKARNRTIPETPGAYDMYMIDADTLLALVHAGSYKDHKGKRQLRAFIGSQNNMTEIDARILEIDHLKYIERYALTMKSGRMIELQVYKPNPFDLQPMDTRAAVLGKSFIWAQSAADYPALAKDYGLSEFLSHERIKGPCDRQQAADRFLPKRDSVSPL